MQIGSDLRDDPNITERVFFFSSRSVSNAVTLLARVCHRRAAGNLRKHWCEKQTDRSVTFPLLTPGSGDMQTCGHSISLRSKDLQILWESGHKWWYFWGQNAFRDVGSMVQKYLAMSPKLLQCWSLARVDSWGLVTKSFAGINSSDLLTESFTVIHPFTSYRWVLGLRTTDLDSWSWSFICNIIISVHRLKQASQEWCGQLCLYL